MREEKERHQLEMVTMIIIIIIIIIICITNNNVDSRQIFQLNPLLWSVLEGNSGHVDTVGRFED